MYGYYSSFGYYGFVGDIIVYLLPKRIIGTT